MSDKPIFGQLFSLKLLREMLVEGLIGEPLDQMARSGPKTPGSVPYVKKKRRIKSVSSYEKRSMRRHLTTLDAARR